MSNMQKIKEEIKELMLSHDIDVNMMRKLFGIYELTADQPAATTDAKVEVQEGPKIPFEDRVEYFKTTRGNVRYIHEYGKTNKGRRHSVLATLQGVKDMVIVYQREFSDSFSPRHIHQWMPSVDKNTVRVSLGWLLREGVLSRPIQGTYNIEREITANDIEDMYSHLPE